MQTEQVQAVLDKFGVTPDDLRLLAQAGELLSGHLGDFVEQWYGWLREQPEFLQFFGARAEGLDVVQKLQLRHWSQFFTGRVDEEFARTRRHIGAVHARIELPNDIYLAGLTHAASMLVERLRELAPQQAEAMQRAIHRLIMVETYFVLDEISRIQREKIVQHSRAIMEVATPVTPIWEGILLLPLLGILDSVRTQDIMNKSLAKIAEMRARVFVLDISGVAAMDTAIANQLLKITKATRLMGCEAILSGISPAVARTVVELGVDVGEVRTTATLRDAFEIALRMVGAGQWVQEFSEGRRDGAVAGDRRADA